MSDLNKILAEIQKEKLKLLSSLNKKQPVCLNVQDSDSETKSISVARKSTPVKTYTATSSKTTPNNSRDINRPTFSQKRTMMKVFENCNMKDYLE